MKQLTMTKVLTPLAALAFTFGTQAAIVPAETFDTYTAGTTVISNQTGWSFTYGNDGADDASAVTAYDNNAPASDIVPDGQSAGANYLKLSTEDGTLFRNLSTDGLTLDLNAGLFVDTDVQFTVTDPSDSPTNTVSADDKLVIWLEATDSATNLCVLGHQFAADGTRSDKVYTLGTSNPIVPGQWYRLTVKAVSSYAASGTFSYPAFQVYLDGTQLSAGQWIAKDGDESDFMTYSGISDLDVCYPYIPARTATMTSLTKVGFSGEGALDSVVVTKDVPAFENPTTLTFTWDSSVISSIDLGGLGLSLSSSGSSVSVYPGQVITLTLNGYNPSTHSFEMTTSSDARATVNSEAKTVTAIAAGAATIALTTTAKDTVDVTLDWDGLLTALSGAGKLTDLTLIGYTVGDTTTTYSLAQLQADEKTSETLSGLKVGTNITVTVTYSTSDWSTTITPASCMTKSGNVLTIASRPESGTATVTISAAGAVVKIGDTPYASLQEAVDAATSGATLTLAQDITLTEAVTVAAGKTLTVDLNGKTITGAADVAVFSNAGALTITDSSTNHDGAVTAGSNGVVVANTGTLDLVYGAYTGTFTGTIDSITADCSFSYDISAGESPVYAIASGYEMAVSAGRYSLATITYTITYKKGDAEITPTLTPATYTVLDNVTLPSATADAGYTFTGWKDANDNAVADWVAGAKTGNLVLTAQFSAASYTITYLNEDGTAFDDWADGYTAPASYTIADAVTLPVAANVDLQAVGVSFGGWTNETGTVTGWAAGQTGNVTVYAKLDPIVAPAGWVDDSSAIPANTSAATQYPDLASSALATADAKELTDWAKANSIAFTDVAADTSGTYVEAFLLNCAVADVAEEKAEFKANITVNADGTVTVTAPDGKDYNGTLQLKGKAALTDAEWTDVSTPSSSYKFYKYELSL